MMRDKIKQMETMMALRDEVMTIRSCVGIGCFLILNVSKLSEEDRMRKVGLVCPHCPSLING